MKLDKIIQKITDGLTGDNEKDSRYLLEQVEKYKNHEMSQEILRECGRLLHQRLPEGLKPEMDKLINDEIASYESALQKSRIAQRERKFDEALSLIEDSVKKIEAANWFKDDRVSEYHCFNEFFEEALYKEYARPTKTLRNPGFPFDQIYFQYGSLLIDLGRFKDAELALTAALQWNPANANMALERAESCKLQGRLDAFFKHTLEVFKYAFRPTQLAHCYRNAGYYFSDNEKWKEAASCYSFSLQFDRGSEVAFSELLYIQEKSGEKIADLVDRDYTKKMCKKYGLPYGPEDAVLGLSYSYGNLFAEQGDIEGAIYCLQIFYDLTRDEEVGKKLEELSAK